MTTISPQDVDPKRSGQCPACGGTDIRTHFHGRDNEIAWCPDCMIGSGLPNGPIVDMRLFQSCEWMREQIMLERTPDAAPAREDGGEV